MLAIALVTDFLLLLTIVICVRLLWAYPHPRHELIFAALTTLEDGTPEHRKARFATGVTELRKVG